jgi:hypothetical protein
MVDLPQYLLTSPYFQLSVAAGLLLHQFAQIRIDFATVTISIIPSLLGFAIGSMAILLAFSSSPIFSKIAEKD